MVNNLHSSYILLMQICKFVNLFIIESNNYKTIFLITFIFYYCISTFSFVFLISSPSFFWISILNLILVNYLIRNYGGGAFCPDVLSDVILN